MGVRAALISLCLLAATPAVATLGDEQASASYRGLCTMPQICSDTSGCASTPVLGELLLTIDGDQTALGRSDQDISPIDHYTNLEDAFPLPELEAHRRSFLVDLSPDGRTRRFALYVQIFDAQTRTDVLRPRHFIMECLEVHA